MTAISQLKLQQLVEVFYVIRRKSDGKFMDYTKTWSRPEVEGRFGNFKDATRSEETISAPTVRYFPDANADGSILISSDRRKLRKLKVHEWEWVRVDATYALTPLAPAADKAA